MIQYNQESSSHKYASLALTDVSSEQGSVGTSEKANAAAYSFSPEPARATLVCCLGSVAADHPPAVANDVLNPTASERAFFDMLATTATATGGGDHSAALSLSVVVHQELSPADISLMRREGCRMRRLPITGAAPIPLPVASSLPSITGSFTGTAADRLWSHPYSTVASSADAAALTPPTGRLSLIGPSRPTESCSAVSSPHLSTLKGSVAHSALETPVAILQRMAEDTAARVAALRSSESPEDMPSAAASRASTSSTPLMMLHQNVCTLVSVPSDDDQRPADHRSLVGSASEQPTSLLRTTQTHQYMRNSASISSMNSLSESELLDAQLRPGTLWHISTSIAGACDAASVPKEVNLGARHSTHRPTPNWVALPAAPQQESAAGCRTTHFGAAATALASPSNCNDDSASPRPISDDSVSNHDFHHILPREVKEALERDMQPLCDDEEEELGLHRALQMPSTLFQVSPTIRNRDMTDVAENSPRTPSAKTGGSEARSGATSSAGGLPGFPSVAIQLRSSANQAAQVMSTTPDKYSARETGHRNSEALLPTNDIAEAASNVEHGVNVSGLPFRAWRFPILGKVNVTSQVSNVSFEMGKNNSECASPVKSAASITPEQRCLPATADGGAEIRQSQDMQPSAPRQPPPPQPNQLWKSHPRPQWSSWPVHKGATQMGCTAILPDTLQRFHWPPPGFADAVPCMTPLSVGLDVTNGALPEGREGSSQPGGGSSQLAALPMVAAGGFFSSAGGGGTSAATNSGYFRQLEMVYTVYERLLRICSGTSAVPQRRYAPSTVDLATSLPRMPDHSPVNGGLNVAHASASVQGPLLSVMRVVSQGGSSPLLSHSGALSRSSGYYSFGKRISLRHPNRQTLPNQFLGQPLNHAASTSPRTATLLSPPISELIMSATANASGITHLGARAAAPGAWTRKSSMDPSIVHRIEARPLLQTTLFLQHNLRLLGGAETRKRREEERRQAPPDSLVTPMATDLAPGVSPLTMSVSAGQLHWYRFPMYEENRDDVPRRDIPAAGSMGEPPGAHKAPKAEWAPSSAAATITLTTTAASPSSGSSNATHAPSGHSEMLPSFCSARKRSNVSNLSVECIKNAQGQQEELLHKQRQASMEASERGSGTVPAESPAADGCEDGTAAATLAWGERDRDVGSDILPMEECASNVPPHYYRALTQAERLVCHVHGVDGVEREVDNEALDLVVYVGMNLMGWLEVVSLLGCGSFGQVFLCKDLRICNGNFVHPSEIEGEDYEYWNCSHAYLPFSSVDAVPTHQPLVAVKVVKSVPLLEQQSVLEAEMLVLIGAQTAPASAGGSDGSAAAPPPEDPRCAKVAKVLADGICYGHHCIVMERYGANLYEYIAANDHTGLPMYQIRAIGAQLFSALSLIHEECHIIHADIKPENVLLTLDSCRGTLQAKESMSVLPSLAASNAAGGPSAHGGTPAATMTTTAAATSQADTLHAAARAEAGGKSPLVEPPRHQQRTELAQHYTPSPSVERSCMTLRVGMGAAVRHRLASTSRRLCPNTALEESALAMGLPTHRKTSFRHLRSCSTSRVTVVEQSDIPAPEPQRLQTLNQSAGMLSSTPLAASSPRLGSALNGYRAAEPTPGEEERTAVADVRIPHLHVRLIDFSSSCYDAGPFYQYIQSRYYRAPEVIMGATYNSGIDVWSTGCVLAELLLGMPLLPGCNDHHQLSLIEEMIGQLPTSMIEEGRNSELYYVTSAFQDEAAAPSASPAVLPSSPSAEVAAAAAPPHSFVLRSPEDYLHITRSEPHPYRRYFTYRTLQELVRHCPLTLEERRMSYGLQPYVPATEPSAIPPDATPSPSVRSDMMKQRFLLFDLLRCLLQTDPKQRPTAAQALTHPFFTSQPPYIKSFRLE